jgi:hypothetical protein
MRDRKTKVSKGRREMTDRAAAERDAARLNLPASPQPELLVRSGTVLEPVPSPRRANKLMKSRASQAIELASGQMQTNQRTKAGLVNFTRRRAAEDSIVAERNAGMDRRTGGRFVIVKPKTA